MLDADLAELYGVPTNALIQAVKRNRGRFPSDFMFQLTEQEVVILKSQTVTSSSKGFGQWGGRRKPLHAFTEQGVAMLSSALRSARDRGQRRAFANYQTVRTFRHIIQSPGRHPLVL
mgnify:FL=1